MDVHKVLEYALDREREGYVFFSDHAASAKHAAVAGVFKRLAAEEQAHIHYVESLIAALASGAAVASPPVAEEDRRFFSERAASEMIEQTTSEAMVPDLPVLRMAYLIERDLAEFYADLAPKATGAAHDALVKLARWEREHERLFRTLHDRVFAEYSNMPWGG
ncbi:MAG TPA: ferritin family protein [Candidatus Krumholzibacteria bacterium]|nr:ferritin family protein [Candidatus Krumholzibacteria bacterium]HPD70257.1 ferritin family protein [Candidatus Krumholzibacteria bacterium]HRY40043.1 ferritin family protein [Candidatus Krumholzibacteria bacterium]